MDKRRNYSFADDGTIIRKPSDDKKHRAENPVANKMGEIRNKINQNNDSSELATESHDIFYESENYQLLESVSQGVSINWTKDISLIEDMYLANHDRSRKDKYDFSGWPNGWLESLASHTSDFDVQSELCHESYLVRMALARNSKLSSSLYYDLAHDNSKNVLRALLERKRLPYEYRSLAEDRLRQLDNQKHQTVYNDWQSSKATSFVNSYEMIEDDEEYEEDVKDEDIVDDSMLSNAQYSGDSSTENEVGILGKIIMWGLLIFVLIRWISGLLEGY